MFGHPPKGGLTGYLSINVDMTERLLYPLKSMGVFLLAGLLMQPGHSQTLPEELTAETIMSFVRANNIENVVELIESLPPLHKEHVVLVFDSRALNKEFVSGTHPRVVSWGADARFILSWATNPDAPDNVEFLQPLADRWDAGVIDFSGDQPELSRPEVCSTCHGEMKRPIWGDYQEWRGTSGDRQGGSELSQILSDLEASDNPKILPLTSANRTIGVLAATSSATGNIGSLPRPAAEFGSMLSLRHAKALFNRLKQRDNYAELAEQAVCGDFYRVTSHFPLEDHYLASMHDGDRLVVVQEDSNVKIAHVALGDENRLMVVREEPDGSLATQEALYTSGNAGVENALKFLVLHDFWSRDKRVSDFYSIVGNEEVSPRFHGYLNYVPGTGTAEQELRASYEQHFRLKGQASLDARIDKETRRFARGSYSISKTAVFDEGHFNFMAPRVCNILRQAPNQTLSQLRIEDGKAAESAGEVTFSVTLDPVASEPVSVDWFTWDFEDWRWFSAEAAVADFEDDYVDTRGVLVFNPGEASKTVTIGLVDDDVAEPPEYFHIHLENASANALIVDGFALATIEGELPPKETRVLTAGFENAPAWHDALAAFTVQLRFSEEVALDSAAFADGLLSLTGGTLGPALRVTEGSNTVWEFPVTPHGEGDIVITLPADRECDAHRTACTPDGRSLAEFATVTIPWSSLPPPSVAPPTSVTPPQGDAPGEEDDMATPGDDSDDGSAGTGAVGTVDDDSGSAMPPGVTAAWGERLPDRDIELPSGSDPTGLWSDGETLWVISDWIMGEVTSYSLYHGTRASHRFSLEAGGYPAGLWSDGETLWVADLASKVSAYRLSDGARQSDRDVPQTVLAAAGNTSPTGLWSDGDTLWVADNQAWKVFAYRLSDKVRVPDKEFELLSADSRLLSPWGLWSDGETALVTLYHDRGVQGFALSGGAYRADRALDVSAAGSSPLGLWSDGETLWVANQGDSLVRAYAVPGPRSAAAPVASSAADPFSVRVITRVDAAPDGADDGPPVYIADTALREAIAGALGQSSGEPVGLNAMARIRSLNVRGSGIAELTGLEYAVNLQALDLGHNTVKDLWTLSFLTYLTVLNLDGAVSDLTPLAGLVGLERLSLRDSGLADVSVLAGLVNLRHLSLRGNALSDLRPLAGLAQLEILDLRGNTVPDRAPLSGLYNLRHLDLTD